MATDCCNKYFLVLFLFFCDIVSVLGQDIETCYGPGSIAGAIIGTLLVTIALMGICVLLYKIYWRSRRGKHLVLVTDVENSTDQYAFDNPCFKEATPIKHDYHNEPKQTGKLDKTRWLAWSPLQPFSGPKNEKIKSLDDSNVNDSHLNVVSLKSHDFTGLGFSICGNMRDGIFIKDVLHRGPAFESGRINSGDRIDSVCISFRHMVFEDALTILSYASPYEVQVEVENSSSSRPSTLIRSKKEANISNSSQAERICHPFYRSQSIADLAEIGKVNNKRLKQHIGYNPDKNIINNCMNVYNNKSNEGSNYPTLKLSPSPNLVKKERIKLEKSEMEWKETSHSSDVTKTDQETSKQNKLHRLGIKVLPIGPKMGTQSFFSQKNDPSLRLESDNEKNTIVENSKQDKEVMSDGINIPDETDSNIKNLFAKGLQNLKEKINQNSLGRKKTKVKPQELPNEETPPTVINMREEEEQVPTPRQRMNLKNQNQQELVTDEVPEEVTRAGDAARSNRKSTASLLSNNEVLAMENVAQEKTQVISLDNINSVKSIAKSYDQSLSAMCSNKMETCSSSECSSDRDSDVVRPKRSKGKAPLPPPKSETVEDNLITNIRVRTTPVPNQDISLSDGKNNIFEPSKSGKIHINNDQDRYDSDSDMEDDCVGNDKDLKIEVCTTEVTVHPSPSYDNEDEIDSNGRKAASLGDLSKYEAEKPLTVLLERAVSLDLANGGNQCGKKRKAPLPPAEEFPTAFESSSFRKEPKLEQQMGLDTFQRRLKKSSDFGTLEDALQDGHLTADEVDRAVFPSVEATNTSNIKEFSSWLEECRKGPDAMSVEDWTEDSPPPKVVFSINGRGVNDTASTGSSETVNFPGGHRTTTTVLVISQPNSLEQLSDQPVGLQFSIVSQEEVTNSGEEETSEQFVTATESKIENDDNEDIPPQLPTSPIPVADPSSFASPLSSLTYITEIKVSSSQDMTPSTLVEQDTPEQDFKQSDMSNQGNVEMDVDIVSSTPEKQSPQKIVFEFLDEKQTPIKRESEEKSPATKLDDQSSGSDGNDSSGGSSRRGSDSQFEISKIPIRTLKSETGQKLLATIQSLAVKEQRKQSDNDQARRVASLFANVNSQTKLNSMKKVEKTANSPKSNIASFYLNASSQDNSPSNGETLKKTPPQVPPRKSEPSPITDNKIIDTVDRKISTFSTFSPPPRNNQQETHVVSRLATWSESVVNKDHDGMNGERDLQVQNEVVNLPVKTSATKIIFENKMLDSEEL